MRGGGRRGGEKREKGCGGGFEGGEAVGKSMKGGMGRKDDRGLGCSRLLLKETGVLFYFFLKKGL